MIRTFAMAAAMLSAPLAAAQTVPAAAPSPAPFKKNWTAPAYKMRGQALVDAMMAKHPELLNMTFHGVPPGGTEYTMFAGSFPDRIGKVSGPDDIMVHQMSRIMIETRYKPTDNPRKFVVLVPLRDIAGSDVATAVFAFRDAVMNEKSSAYYVSLAIQLRDEMAQQITSYGGLFAKTN